MKNNPPSEQITLAVLDKTFRNLGPQYSSISYLVWPFNFFLYELPWRVFLDDILALHEMLYILRSRAAVSNISLNIFIYSGLGNKLLLLIIIPFPFAGKNLKQKRFV